eukprot:531860_1
MKIIPFHIVRSPSPRLIQSFPNLQLDGIVYLRTTPETCLDRLHQRGRHEETSVSVDYLTKLHRRHEEWFMEKVHTDAIAKEIRDVPVLILDTNDEFETDSEVSKKMLKAVHDFIDKTCSVEKV